jgi:hypothetical protein
MRNRTYKAIAKYSKSNSLNLNLKQFVSVKKSKGILVRTLKDNQNTASLAVGDQLKDKHDTTAQTVGLKCKKSQKN